MLDIINKAAITVIPKEPFIKWVQSTDSKAAESNPDNAIRTGLVQKGYVSGIVEKEPAVLPLNSALASIAVQTLLDQYRTQAAPAATITVFECHNGFACYADTASINAMPGICSACGRNVAPLNGEQQRSAA